MQIVSNSVISNKIKNLTLARYSNSKNVLLSKHSFNIINLGNIILSGRSWFILTSVGRFQIKTSRSSNLTWGPPSSFPLSGLLPKQNSWPPKCWLPSANWPWHNVVCSPAADQPDTIFSNNIFFLWCSVQVLPPPPSPSLLLSSSTVLLQGWHP